MQAVASVARDTTDPDRRWDLEELGERRRSEPDARLRPAAAHCPPRAAPR